MLIFNRWSAAVFAEPAAAIPEWMDGFEINHAVRSFDIAAAGFQHSRVPKMADARYLRYSYHWSCIFLLNCFPIPT